MKIIERPKTTEYNPYYANYINGVNKPVIECLTENGLANKAFILSLSQEQLNFSYAPGKWNIKSVIQHIIDVEIVKLYRALCIARGDKTLLPGFDHDNYAERADLSQASSEQLAELYFNQRKVTLALFKSFSETELQQIGNANNSPLSARAVAYIIAGHEKHHFKIIKEKYLGQL